MTKLVLGLDIGSSSARMWVFEPTHLQTPVATWRGTYDLHTTADGGATLDAEALRVCLEAGLDQVLADLPPNAVAAVGCATLAGNLLGLDQQQQVITPVWTWADTRAATATAALRASWPVSDVYQRTGCPLHSAYAPARLQWLKTTQPMLLEQVAHWMTLGEYLTLHWTGKPLLSYALASWNGLLNRFTHSFDTWLLDHLPLHLKQLAQPQALFALGRPLRAAYAQRWPALAQARWLPPVGDGLASNIGCGGTHAQRVVINLGTSGALRVVLPAQGLVPTGLWRYVIDHTRELVGGAISNGGNLVEWAQETLQLPQNFDQALTGRTPGSHQLLVVPTLAGERSPGYRDDLRGTIHGLRLHTDSLDILQAFMEATACSLATIYDLLKPQLPPDHQIVCSGGALQNSAAWRQMLCDALGQPLQLLDVDEATVRGAALLAHWALTQQQDDPLNVRLTHQPNPKHHQLYRVIRQREQQLRAALSV